MKRLLEHDPLTGVTEWAHIDEMSDECAIQHTQDVEPIIERNKRLQNEGPNMSADKSLHWIGSIPLVIAHKWIVEDGINWLALPKPEMRSYVNRKLSDPDYRYLRVSSIL